FAFADESAPAPTGLSPNGRWLVLVGPSGATSSFAVIDTGLLKVVAVAEVPGAFTYDAISDDGSSLYLTERIGAETARNLGLHAAIDATTLKVRQTARVTGLPSASGAGQEALAPSAVSRDGRKLYFPADRGIALVDTKDFALRGVFLTDRVVTSLSLSADGH